MVECLVQIPLRTLHPRGRGALLAWRGIEHLGDHPCRVRGADLLHELTSSDPSTAGLTRPASGVYITIEINNRRVEYEEAMSTTDTLDRTFAALADPTRRAILARLASGQASVTELAAPFSISLPAVSKHLKVLERAGLEIGRAH